MIPNPVIKLSIERDVLLEIGFVTEYTVVDGRTTMTVYLGNGY